MIRGVYRVVAALAVVASLGPGSALHVRADDDLPEVLIRAESPGDGRFAVAERGFETTEDSTGFVEVIDTRDLWRGFTTVSEVLEHSVGAQVRSYGGRDDFATLSVRGSRAGQVKVLIDGINLGRAQNQVVNLADLPLDSVERIEIYRGFTPVGFAASGAASVVNIITKKPETAQWGLAATYGALDTTKLTAFLDTPAAGGVLGAGITHRSTRGDFEFVDDVATDNQDDATTSERRNNASESIDTSLRWRRPLADDLELSLQNQLFHKNEELPGLGRFQSDQADQQITRNLFALALGDRNDNWNVQGDVTWLGQQIADPWQFDRPARDRHRLGYGFASADTDTWAGTLSGRWSRSLGDWHLLEASIETGFEGFHGRYDQSTDVERISLADGERNTLAVAVGDEIWMPGIDLTASLQLRHQQLWNRFDEDTFTPGAEQNLPASHADSTDPRIGLRWDPHPDLTVRANLGTYFRPPNFGELFGDTGFTTANVDLEPETGTSGDVGIIGRWRWGRWLPALEAEWVWFQNDIDNLIAIITTSQRRAKAFNIGKARIRGHELRLEATGPAGLSLSANYTLQDTENLSAATEVHGNDLPSVPEEELYLRLGWRYGWFLASWEYDLVGDHYTDEPNSDSPRTHVQTRRVHNLELQMAPAGSDFTFTLELDNLGDSLVPDVYGFPVPGRTWYVTVSYRGSSDER